MAANLTNPNLTKPGRRDVYRVVSSHDDLRRSTISTATATTTNRHVVIDSPIGPLTLVRDDGGLTGLYYPGHRTNPDPTAFGPQVELDNDPDFDEAIAQLHEYFAGERKVFDLPLNPRGSDRVRRVWQLLDEIPHGQTTTYGALVRRIGDRISPQYLLKLEDAIPVAPQALW